MDLDSYLEDLWGRLLSHEPELVRAAFASLDREAQAGVLAHLNRMVSEEGWHPLQQESARIALDALKSAGSKEDDGTHSIPPA